MKIYRSSEFIYVLSIVEISLPTNIIFYRIDACEPRSRTSHPLETSFFFFEQTHISLIIKGSTLHHGESNTRERADFATESASNVTDEG